MRDAFGQADIGPWRGRPRGPAFALAREKIQGEQFGDQSGQSSSQIGSWVSPGGGPFARFDVTVGRLSPAAAMPVGAHDDGTGFVVLGLGERLAQ